MSMWGGLVLCPGASSKQLDRLLNMLCMSAAWHVRMLILVRISGVNVNNRRMLVTKHLFVRLMARQEGHRPMVVYRLRMRET